MEASKKGSPRLTNPSRVAMMPPCSAAERQGKPTNVTQVRLLSPFRYPGGKTWLVPEIRRWLLAARTRPSVFVEPFAGGAIAGLTEYAGNG